MNRNVKSVAFLTVVSVANLVASCSTINTARIQSGQRAMAKEAKVIFNPAADYMVPPGGFFVPDLLDVSTGTPVSLGPVWLFPGTSVMYNPLIIEDVATHQAPPTSEP